MYKHVYIYICINYNIRYKINTYLICMYICNYSVSKMDTSNRNMYSSVNSVLSL